MTDTPEAAAPQVDDDPKQPGDGESDQGLRVVVRRDALGRPVETIEVESIEAAAHWNDDLWEPLR